MPFKARFSKTSMVPGMPDLVPGANISLREVGNLKLLRVSVEWDAGRESVLADRLGVAALPLVDDALPGRDHVVFGNQPTSPDESTRLGASNGVVEIDLNAVPADVNRIAIIVFVHPKPGAAKRALSQLKSLRAVVSNAENGAPISQSVNLASQAAPVTALIVGEVYRRGNEWKFRVNGQGFDQGLDAALQQYGGRS